MKNLSLTALTVSALAYSLACPADQFDNVRKVADSICTIVKVGEFTNGVMFVDYTLKPEADSDIICRIELPPPEKWTGDFWGTGNSSLGGSLLRISDLSLERHVASATTDLGTRRYVSGDLKRKELSKAVFRDFFWRATHLMTVYGKRITKAYYGRAPKHAYFRGGSCGGRQGLSTVMRFPADYDGVIVAIPAAMAGVCSAQLLNLYNQTHDAKGKALVTREQLRMIADAAIEYRKDKDPKPYAGHILANPFFTESDIDGLIELVASKDASLADADHKTRLKNIFMGAKHNGKTLCHGMLPGTFFGFKNGRSFETKGGILVDMWNRRHGTYLAPDWDQFEQELALNGAEENACSLNLDAFRKRGGKLVVLCGWEDQTTPCPEVVAWYEMLAERYGGYAKLQKFCRLFPLPGHAHGGGKGRISTGVGYHHGHLMALRDWVETGKAPETFPHYWKELDLTFPIPPYPLMCYQDDSGNWQTKRYPKGMVRHPDPSLYQTNLTP